MDPYLVHKCREARRVAESSRTAYEALYNAYRFHLHWIDPASLPPGSCAELADMRRRLCRCPDAVGIKSEDIRVRALASKAAEELRSQLVRLCLEVEALDRQEADGNHKTGRARRQPA